LFSVVLSNSVCTSLANCIGPAIDAYPPLHEVTQEDVESVLRGCTSTVSDQVVSLDSAGQSDALAAIRTALDASFPPTSRIKPEDVIMIDDVWWWPEVDASRGKALFYVDAPSSWGWGDMDGYQFGPGGAISVDGDPSNLAGVASGKWVRTRVDEELEIDTARQTQALVGGAQAIATDFPPSGDASSWSALDANSSVFWIPGGMPVRCNPVTAPEGVECSALLLEDLSCEVEITASEAQTTQASTTSTMPGDGGDSPGGDPISTSAPEEEEETGTAEEQREQQQVSLSLSVRAAPRPLPACALLAGALLQALGGC
jgi:hypothetical protein